MTPERSDCEPKVNTPARLLAEKILAYIWSKPVGDTNERIWLEPLLEDALEKASRDFAVKVTGDMHKDIYWQAGEIDRLTRALAEAKKSAFEDGYNKGGKDSHLTAIAVRVAKEEGYAEGLAAVLKKVCPDCMHEYCILIRGTVAKLRQKVVCE